MKAMKSAGLGILSALVMVLFVTGCVQIPTGSTSSSASPAVAPAQTNFVPAEATVGQTYIVAATVSRSTPRTLEITYQGGQDAAYLQYISITVNGISEGSIGPVSGALSLPMGTSELFAAHDPGQDHVVGTGHFTNNGVVTDQVVLETTL
ncbi:hypothetical protein [Methanoregula sp.]|uniref:hypothetical protein n=1 Tax=Methanoregula sp. TaxID=2052170 RepID=UPI002B788919|nr:hypothetical protein [Methanoregula sp.]HVP96509.1 hypothetical protein [Methanoregula sp.]